MPRGIVTITLASADASIERGMRLCTSGTSGPPTTYWVVGKKSPTELIVAATWRDSLWVLWFQIIGWLSHLWWSVRSRFRWHDEDTVPDEESESIFVPPADESEREMDPKKQN